jgi:phytoene dehydrogenase-like protein
MTDTDVAVVGAGHNGLVAAHYLARAGLRVELFERRPFVGGAAITEELWPGYRFSTCAHMTHALHPKVIRDLRLVERGLEVIPRTFSVQLRPDGTYDAAEEHAWPRNRATRLSAAERDADRRYAEFKATLRAIFAPYRLRVPPTPDEVRRDLDGRPAATVFERALAARVSDLQAELLPTDELRERYAAEVASIGRDPWALALAYGSISEPDPETGQRPPNGYVRGGTGVLSQLLAAAAEEAGARIHLGRAADRLLVEDGAAIGVRLADGTAVRARLVVSNLDPKRTFGQLVPDAAVPGELRRRVDGLVTEVSCLKLLAVVSELPEWTAWDGDPALPGTGLVGLSRSRAEVAAAYDDLEAGRPPRAPMINFSVPSVLDPSLAQPGGHTASLWIYPAVGRLRDGSWDDVRDRVADRLVEQITACAPNFRGSIRQLKLRTPLDLERENGLTDGCIWHVQHGGDQLFWRRPLPELAAYRAPLRGLYLCGAGQHPGGEISGLPGHNAAQEAIADLERGVV